jgi:hypothetical protein
MLEIQDNNGLFLDELLQRCKPWPIHLLLLEFLRSIAFRSNLPAIGTAKHPFSVKVDIKHFTNHAVKRLLTTETLDHVLEGEQSVQLETAKTTPAGAALHRQLRELFDGAPQRQHRRRRVQVRET